MLWYQLIYAAFCVFFAYENKKRIVADKPIPHWLNGLVHFICWVIYWVMFRDISVLALPIVARLFFDVALNLFRGLSVGYVPEDPSSVADSVEKRLFDGNGTIPKFVYLLLIIVDVIAIAQN